MKTKQDTPIDTGTAPAFSARSRGRIDDRICRYDSARRADMLREHHGRQSRGRLTERRRIGPIPLLFLGFICFL
jgi:hypothetical protein